MSDVFLDHVFVGVVDDPNSFVKRVRELRRRGEIPNVLNVYYNEDEDVVELLSERGRARRPLIVVENGKPLLTPELVERVKRGELKWSDLVDQGVIEFLDSDEEENAFIALRPEDVSEKHTHLELSPLVILGLATAMLPFAEYNHGPRVTFGSKLQRQGLGVYSQSFHVRQDTDVYLLHYPQRPIVTTSVFKHLNYDEHPVGQNVVIAVMSFEGFNMQDAIIFNKSSIDRGLFRATYFKPYKDVELRYLGGQVDVFEVPDKEVSGYKEEEVYAHLEEDGLVYPEAVVSYGDVVIGKTSPPRFLADIGEFRVGVEVRRDSSTVIDDEFVGIVDQVVLTENENGSKIVKVKVRVPKIPEIGDKFTSRHGQKGVIGMVYNQEDLPFTRDGVVPDIIFNPHSLPSRMTVSQLLEIIGGKAGALNGEFVDGTPFEGVKEGDVVELLKRVGFEEDGGEWLFDGVTGKRFRVKILVGNIYYCRLKHLVSNKLHARARGPTQLLTRQPTEGRSKEGGLRLGEMEKDVLIAHGASLLLKERFDSDKTVVPVCEGCGLIAVYNKFRGEAVCPSCVNSNVHMVEMSYAFKLLLDELRSLGIHPKLNLELKRG